MNTKAHDCQQRQNMKNGQSFGMRKARACWGNSSRSSALLVLVAAASSTIKGWAIGRRKNANYNNTRIIIIIRTISMNYDNDNMTSTSSITTKTKKQRRIMSARTSITKGGRLNLSQRQPQRVQTRFRQCFELLSHKFEKVSK